MKTGKQAAALLTEMERSCTLELGDLQTSLGLCLKHGDGKIVPKVPSASFGSAPRSS